MRFFKKLRRKLDYLDTQHIAKIYQAYLEANRAHEGQLRRTGEPYISHPVAVACILADMKMDAGSIMAALLHDVLEDTAYTIDRLNELFGEQVGVLVDGVTKLTQVEFETRAEAQAEYFRKMVLAMSQDIRVIIVKLADRLHNMRTLHSLTLEKRRRIAKETLDIFAPIAVRLGMHNFSVELEELGFAALYPARYRVLSESVRKARGNRKEILTEIESTLKAGLARVDLTRDVFGREKHLYGIYKKMKDKHSPFSQIMDVYAFRIIVASKDECYRALGAVHGIYKPVPERFKDYIAIPKANGYQSLHTTLFGPHGVPIEIQVRTKEMNVLAERGIAAHWLYKVGEDEVSEEQIRAQQWVKSLLEMQQRTGSSLEFVENVKVDLFPDEVYVFTPDGTIMEFPSGATAVDFAYAVHTDIGNTCVAVKIDQQLAPLSAVLSSGQKVEIIASKNARPSPMWLDFVVTAKARSSIRHFLKHQRHTESIALGKKLLSHALSSRNVQLESLPQTAFDLVLHESNLPGIDDLYEEIGLGNRVALLEANRLVKFMETKQAPSTEAAEESLKPLYIRGTEGMVVKFARNCCPVPGDPIVGILVAGHGIEVHTDSCKDITKLRHHRDRVIPVRWAEEMNGEFFANLTVEFLDQRGGLAKMAMAISNVGINIDDIDVVKRTGHRYFVRFRIQVQDRVHLAKAMRGLRKLSTVLRIHRGG